VVIWGAKIYLSLNYIGQHFSTNRFLRNIIQLIYKIDICPLTCKKHVLFIFYFF
jgi:hypothetical protein